MPSTFVRPPAPAMPPKVSNRAEVRVHPLQAGHLTLPERFFVHPASQTAVRTVPSFSFLIQHEDIESGKTSRILFDLGLRRTVERYPEPIQKHIQTRLPLTTDPDVTKSLAAGGLAPDDIDYVIYSHVHWDHVGEPRDFQKSVFVVGHGAIDLLKGTPSPSKGSHSHFESDLLPDSRFIELSDPHDSSESIRKPIPAQGSQAGQPDFNQPWRSHGPLPRVLDIFRDGSVLIVDAPGHLPGHINILAKTGPMHSVYLAGDACHDRRILKKERAIGQWEDAEGHICCIHGDRQQAEQTINRIAELEQQGVEIIFAHDIDFEENPKNQRRFFGQDVS